MSEKHIMFHKMSQLIDNDIATEEERKSILDHINSCDLCKREYARLQEMMKLFSKIRNNDKVRSDFSGLVLKGYLTRKRKPSFSKVLPAVAAAVFFILAFGVNNYWQGAKDSAKVVSSSVNISSASDTRNVIDIISHNNAKILKVTDAYIEGEVTANSFKHLRKELGFRKVAYSLAGGESGKSLNFIEEVGTISKQTDSDAMGNDSSVPSIRFRVYK